MVHEEADTLSLPLPTIQRPPGILPAVPGAFRVALRAFIAHPRASPRKRRFVIEPLVRGSRLIARPLSTLGPTLPRVRGSRLVAEPLFALKVSIIIGAASWRGTLETGTGAATTFGVVTGAIGTTTPG